ncbi:MAG: hypothetical protein ABI478_05825 [Propionivibrio sp.]
MEFMTYVLAAEEDEYTALGDSVNPLEEWSGIEAPGLDTVKLATLHCLLTEDSLQTALDAYEPIYESANDTIVLRVADQLLEKLAELDEEALEELAEELAASEEYEREHWDVDDVLDYLMELCELAQLAESQGQLLFVSLSLAHDEAP